MRNSNFIADSWNNMKCTAYRKDCEVFFLRNLLKLDGYSV